LSNRRADESLRDRDYDGPLVVARDATPLTLILVAVFHAAGDKLDYLLSGGRNVMSIRVGVAIMIATGEAIHAISKAHEAVGCFSVGDLLSLSAR
jgi:hypothetical protein